MVVFFIVYWLMMITCTVHTLAEYNGLYWFASRSALYCLHKTTMLLILSIARHALQEQLQRMRSVAETKEPCIHRVMEEKQLMIVKQLPLKTYLKLLGSCGCVCSWNNRILSMLHRNIKFSWHHKHKILSVQPLNEHGKLRTAVALFSLENRILGLHVYLQ